MICVQWRREGFALGGGKRLGLGYLLPEVINRRPCNSVSYIQYLYSPLGQQHHRHIIHTYIQLCLIYRLFLLQQHFAVNRADAYTVGMWGERQGNDFPTFPYVFADKYTIPKFLLKIYVKTTRFQLLTYLKLTDDSTKLHCCQLSLQQTASLYVWAHRRMPQIYVKARRRKCHFWRQSKLSLTTRIGHSFQCSAHSYLSLNLLSSLVDFDLWFATIHCKVPPGANATLTSATANVYSRQK